MKSVSNLVFMLCICSSFYSHSVLAQSVNHLKSKDTVSLKCYVELIGGGGNILYYHGLPKSEKERFADQLLLKSSQGNNKTRSIYKVNECVEVKYKFKEKIANTLEIKLNMDN